MKNTPYYNLIFFAACVVYVLTAYFSSGYYHADEQYQVIEFAGFRLGTHQAHDLAWEFGERIRPSLQPLLAAGVLKLLITAGITDVYTQAFILRLLTALFALFVIHRFVCTGSQMVKYRNRTLYAGLSYLLWFLPVLNLRFSSEALSGLSFMLALSELLSRDRQRRSFASGIWLGISFLFRFQSAFMTAGLLLWLVFVKREHLKTLLKVAAGGLLALGAGLLCDYYFYGVFTCTFWNYFHANIVKDVASEFGVSPWFYYLEGILNYPTYFFGIWILLAFVTLLLKKPGNVLLWIMVPFIVLHSFIPHKEERFLFPLVNMVPLLLVLALQQWQQVRVPAGLKVPLRVLRQLLLLLLLLVNTTGLLAMMLKPAGLGRMALTGYIDRHYKGRPVELVYCTWSNPYRPWSLEARFYHNPAVRHTEIQVLNQLDTLPPVPGTVRLVVARKEDIAYENGAEALRRNGYTKKMQSIPEWILDINVRLKLLDNKQVLELYERAPGS